MVGTVLGICFVVLVAFVVVGSLIVNKLEPFKFDVGDAVIARNVQSVLLRHAGLNDSWRVVRRYKGLFWRNRYVLEGMYFNGQQGRRRESESSMLRV